MNTVIRTGLCVLIAGCILNYSGCKKKTAESPPPPPVTGTETKPAAESEGEAAVMNIAQPASTALEAAPVADVEAEVTKLNIEQLMAKAMEYKDAIVAQKANIEKVTEKLKAIPITEQMGTEAKALQAEITNLNKSVTALTERFQVYYNKLKEMGGDVSGLKI